MWIVVVLLSFVCGSGPGYWFGTRARLQLALWMVAALFAVIAAVFLFRPAGLGHTWLSVQVFALIIGVPFAFGLAFGTTLGWFRVRDGDPRD